MGISKSDTNFTTLFRAPISMNMIINSKHLLIDHHVTIDQIVFKLIEIILTHIKLYIVIKKSLKLIYIFIYKSKHNIKLQITKDNNHMYDLYKSTYIYIKRCSYYLCKGLKPRLPEDVQ